MDYICSIGKVGMIARRFNSQREAVEWCEYTRENWKSYGMDPPVLRAYYNGNRAYLVWSNVPGEKTFAEDGVGAMA
jgi:hypothetical protein